MANPNVAPGVVSNLVAITKSDSTVYNPPLTSLWVGGTGDVAVLAAGDTTAQTLVGIPSFTLINWIAIKKVMSTNTSATLMVGGHN